MVLSEIFCKITINSDYIVVLSEIYCKNAMLEQVPDGHCLLEDAAVGIVLRNIKLSSSIEKVFDSAQ